MFGNKKNDEPNDDLQITTRSMKSDMENTSPEETEDLLESSSSSETQPLQKNTESGMDKLKEQMKKADKQNATPPSSSPKTENLSNFSSYNEKISKKDSAKEQTMEVESEQKGSSLSTIFSILLLIVLFTAAGAGAYYYFFIINGQPQPAPTEDPVTPAPDDDPPIDPIVPPEDLPAALSGANILELQEGAGIESILAGSTDSENGLQEGFYTVREGGQQNPMEINQVQPTLEIQLPEESATAIKDFWLYYKPAPDDDSSSLIGLLFEIDNEKIDGIEQSYLKNESALPQMFSGLYPGISEDDPRLENAEFTPSQDNEGFRYHNLTPDKQSKSLDWGIIETENAAFLAIATSRGMANEMVSKIKE